MKLVYTANKSREVKVWDIVKVDNEDHHVTKIEPPRHGGSTGRVYIKPVAGGSDRGYFPSIIDAEWIEREDQA